jgi:drug/metabolite transporter (DMT)-like permease
MTKLLVLLALVLSSLCYGTASVLQARAAQSVRKTTRTSPGLMLVLVRRATYLGALALSAMGFVCQVPALRYFPLFIVQTAQAANLAVVAVVGIPLLGLRLHARDWTSIVGVVMGVSLLMVSFITIQHRTAPPGDIRLALLLWTLFLAIVSYAARRLRDDVSSVALGLIAGLAFGIVGVAVRVMPTLSPTALLRDPALYALAAGGIMGFMFYADGLQRGSVTSTTAALLLAQIVEPTLLGIFVLGDKVKQGFYLPATLGGVIAVTAAISLARFGHVSDHRRV